EGKSAWDIAKFYGDYFVDGLKRLAITEPTYLPKATDHIQEQIELVQKLEEKGLTYRISDGIYYDTSKFPRYADFAKLDLDEQQAGARVEHNPEKRNPTDFALWKFSPAKTTRDMEWDSPWGKGFPGWHLECSAMSMKYLGETMDVHAGGIDHIPVHHTNEIAQSEVVTDKPVAQLWMHTNHITVSGEKVSKSLGNGITLEDIEAKGYSLTAFRLHILESHYRNQSKFSWESLEAAQNRLRELRAFADLRFQIILGKREPFHAFDKLAGLLLGDMQNDLNSPVLLAELSGLATLVKDGGFANEEESFNGYLEQLDLLFGLQLTNSEDISQDIKDIISEREKARKAKDWAASDKLRGQLEEQGIGVRDTQHGPIWCRI
ncbi:MAG: cysteine--tRNA ligase, partial [Patescibacteria group bacterium]